MTAKGRPTVIHTEVMVLPTGMPVEDVNARHFAVYVRRRWGGWVVSTLFRDECLSVKGRRWCAYVTPRQRRFYVFPTLPAALDAAVAVVDSRKVNGRTWAEWS